MWLYCLMSSCLVSSLVEVEDTIVDSSPFRLAELIAALSLATDLGMGQPMEYVLRSCALSVRVGETLGLSVSELREVYYLALLRYLGCNAGTHEQAALVGDEVAVKPVLDAQNARDLPVRVVHAPERPHEAHRHRARNAVGAAR